MVQLVVQGLPDGGEAVEVYAHVLRLQVLVGVEDDLETVSVHPSALVSGGDVGEAVRGFKAETSPDVGVVGKVEVCALVQGALHADRGDAG